LLLWPNYYELLKLQIRNSSCSLPSRQFPYFGPANQLHPGPSAELGQDAKTHWCVMSATIQPVDLGSQSHGSDVHPTYGGYHPIKLSSFLCSHNV
jgi:hypothetical protein